MVRNNMEQISSNFIFYLQIFKSNEFFCGLTIPDPGTIEPLEKKIPKDLVGQDGIDFLKVQF